MISDKKGSVKGMLTTKQHQILSVIVDGDGAGVENGVDLSRLLELLPYKTSKESMHFSIRALAKHELIVISKEKRRGALRAVYRITKEAEKLLFRKHSKEEEVVRFEETKESKKSVTEVFSEVNNKNLNDEFSFVVEDLEGIFEEENV